MPNRGVSGGPARARRPSAAAWAALGAAALAALVHRSALGVGFATDDLILLERVRGIVAWPWTPWRLVSGRLWWMLAFPAFGTRAAGWHAASLALHALNAALVTRWAERLGLRAPAALLAGGLFGVASCAMTVLWPATAIGELLACTCALAGLLALGGPAPRPWLAFAAFAAGLLSKESVALVPLAAWWAGPREARAARLRAAWPALAAGVALWAWLLLARDRTGSLEGEAYAFGFGPHLLANLREYAAWAVDRAGLQPPTGIVAATLGVPGVLALVALLALAARSAPAAGGMALFTLALLPVLPLTHHTYIHYLYVPLAGWCVALGAAAEFLAGRWREGRAAWAVAVALLYAATLASTYSLAVTATATLPTMPLPADAFVRRFLVERNAAGTLAQGLPADARALVVLRPAETRRVVSVTRGVEVGGPGRDSALAAGGTPRYDLLAGTLDEGRGLRALFPALRDVRFEDTLAPGDSAATLATAAVDGRIEVTGLGPAGVAPIADLWVRNRLRTSAGDLLRSALAIWPADSGLAWRARALARAAAPSR